MFSALTGMAQRVRQTQESGIHFNAEKVGTLLGEKTYGPGRSDRGFQNISEMEQENQERHMSKKPRGADLYR